jgi:predicted transcriptional regulator
MPKNLGSGDKAWTDSDIAELRSFVDQEMSVEEMAEELGRTPAAVRAQLAKEGISLTAAKEDFDDE